MMDRRWQGWFLIAICLWVVIEIESYEDCECVLNFQHQSLNFITNQEWTPSPVRNLGFSYLQSARVIPSMRTSFCNPQFADYILDATVDFCNRLWAVWLLGISSRSLWNSRRRNISYSIADTVIQKIVLHYITAASHNNTNIISDKQILNWSLYNYIT